MFWEHFISKISTNFELLKEKDFQRIKSDQSFFPVKFFFFVIISFCTFIMNVISSKINISVRYYLGYTTNSAKYTKTWNIDWWVPCHFLSNFLKTTLFHFINIHSGPLIFLTLCDAENKWNINLFGCISVELFIKR